MYVYNVIIDSSGGKQRALPASYAARLAGSDCAARLAGSDCAGIDNWPRKSQQGDNNLHIKVNFLIFCSVP